MKKLLVLILLLGTLSAIAQNPINNMRGRISKVKVVLKNQEVIKGILHSATDSSIFVIPDVKKKKEVKNRQFSLKEIESRDIRSISMKKKGRGALIYLYTTTSAGIVGWITGRAIGGYALIGTLTIAIGIGILSGVIAAIPTKYNVNFADQFRPSLLRKLRRNSLVRMSTTN